MAKTPNTGHEINVANMKNMNSKVAGYGVKYNPNNTNLKLTTLQQIQTDSDTSVGAVTGKLKANKEVIAARHKLFVPSKKFATRVLRAVKASDVDDSVIEQTRSLVMKIRGERITPIAKSIPPEPGVTETDPGKTIKIHSASHQSFVNIVGHFNGLITLLKDETNFAPNETDLTVTAITAMVAQMKAANDACYDADTDFINAIITRNKLMYTPKTGLCDIALMAKDYVSSVFGLDSKEYKEILSIKFTKFKTN